ncbi:hypothetical protein [Solidesulfovibrio magneticus]|uniref:Nucleotidyltransferase n=1 Tax=Solidesulfovibrio magneticus (strain ATCC 700980 / DSM 13731 / RS-1) TaxID=573370 RepID=C4XNH8_SOLM1|nr:hypothetical protein [Solidesulfovibrio magneticus]BAH74953.1 hypothetical protein DMR_14620 [Solidesulfovibrio magneticus RS-1]
MTADEYLRSILAREAVDTSQTSPVIRAANALYPIINGWAGIYLNGIQPSGSFAKGTANHSGTDIDLFISLLSNTPDTLKEIYNTLFNALSQNGHSPRKQNVSINVKVNGYSVDLVPGRLQDPSGLDHSLYRRKADTWTKTNIHTHINYVASCGRTQETRVLKLWRNQNALDFPSFYLEMTVINALAGKNMGLSANVLHVLDYIKESFMSARVVDPANTNNIVSDDLTDTEKRIIKSKAEQALTASNWGQIVI